MHESGSKKFTEKKKDIPVIKIVVVDFICCQYFYFFIFNITITYFFQGKEEDSDKMIRMERATPLFSEGVVLLCKYW